MSILQAANQPADTSLARGALRHELVKKLLADIFEGRIPAGSRLIVTNLTHRFALSSTPVREALLELEAIGVIQFMHNRGAIVKPFGPKQVFDIFQLRRILEVEATRCACGHIDEGDLRQLHQELLDLGNPRRSKQWLEREMAADRQLHGMVAAQCGNIRLEEELHRYDTLVHSLRDVVSNKGRLPELAVAEHLDILNALMANAADAAAAAMARHIDRAAQSIVSVMFHQE